MSATMKIVAPTPLVISQVYDVRFVNEEAVEVQAGDAVYLVGDNAEDGETIIRPDWLPGWAVWRMEGFTVLDALELCQVIDACPHCNGSGAVEELRRDPADVLTVECPECEGRGWVER